MIIEIETTPGTSSWNTLQNFSQPTFLCIPPPNWGQNRSTEFRRAAIRLSPKMQMFDREPLAETWMKQFIPQAQKSGLREPLVITLWTIKLPTRAVCIPNDPFASTEEDLSPLHIFGVSPRLSSQAHLIKPAPKSVNPNSVHPCLQRGHYLPRGRS